MKNQNSHFKNSNNRTNASTNNNTNTDNSIKNAKNVNIAHFDAKVLVYVWLISFISVLFLSVAGYIILDNKIQEQTNNLNSFVAGLLKGPQVLK